MISYAYAAGVLALKAFGFYLFRWVNSQKHSFRRNPEAPIWGKRAEYISTKRGTKLLVSGFWGVCRHLNYTGDIILSWAWCLPCGFDSVAPYFYGLYFTTLDLHRCHRDHRACLEKYGDDWKEYCRRVPYVFIPRVF
ncbi:erg4/erg24 family protein [Cavenderia fasciculata]|uniref:Erg4/erg24 family protein n=1 Tax=Cavenderia fasciculata TaxID=261658 RepID=F4QBT1_CACFS|nr:erg4/erg24 family protein [Cavenderia fasciculata]EGG14669.1 erg4/erg24 family protein [Cavenderia fasciculata]|eukprot:XP_004351177.1 erg4/erg24 family protein [Cavenderia fasciculata]